MHPKSLGNLEDIRTEPGKLILTSGKTRVTVSAYTSAIIRINISNSLAADDHSFAVIRHSLNEFPDINESESNIEWKTSSLTLRITKSPLRFSFYTPDGHALSEDDPRFGTTYQGSQITTYRKLYQDERFIGLGEKTGNLDRRGSSFVNWNSDHPHYGITSDPLYQTFPFFIGLHSSLCYGIFLDNTHKSFFDFGATTDDQMSWFGADGGDMNYYFFGAQTPAKIIEDYTWLTGRMEMPPLWSLGYQQCRWSYEPDKQVLEVAEQFRKKKIPADVIYLDIDYMDQYKIFTWDPLKFPDPKGMIDKLKSIGFHIVTIVDPGIKIEKGYKQYDEGLSKRYFATYPNGDEYTASVWPGRCHFPDFFREDVRNWWGKSFTALTDAGVEGFWNDMNEPAAWGQNIPSLVQFGKYSMPEVRNAYGLAMSQATYEGTKSILGNQRPFVLTRAAYSGVQRYSTVWTGDNTASDEHMLLGQRMVNSLGIIGLSMVGVDIGGFSGDPTPELMVRWNSLGVYTPIFRNHAAIDTKMQEPWCFGEENEKIIRKDIEYRYMLLPYIYSSLYNSHLNGMPLSRTLALSYSHDPEVFDTNYQNQFLFGDAFLVAPVESNRLSAEVYLPEGTWFRLTSEEAYEGRQIINVPAPLNDLPVFVKSGAIIPMQSLIQSTSEKSDGILQIHIWNGPQLNKFIYYEDDGSSYDYQNGAYYKREIQFDPDKRKITISQTEGSFDSMFSKINLSFHRFEGSLKKIKVNADNVDSSTKDKNRYFQITNDSRTISISY
ncbi:MAG TPA: glycoside hydrolase family 31 [Sphingobacteriaceae bacterium]|nr:glycoside hydrolase family 31 [Sphingobacteriaceae bacterium]